MYSALLRIHQRQKIFRAYSLNQVYHQQLAIISKPYGSKIQKMEYNESLCKAYRAPDDEERTKIFKDQIFDVDDLDTPSAHYLDGDSYFDSCETRIIKGDRMLTSCSFEGL